jgi:chromosome partitioning protein
LVIHNWRRMCDKSCNTPISGAHARGYMANTPKTPPPPYFNIAPEKAAARLSEPIDTARFAKAAAFAAKGRDDLAKRGYAPDGKKRLRRFSTWEVCRYLIDVAPAHLRRVLKAHPDLPQGSGEAGSKWFTLEEVLSRPR